MLRTQGLPYWRLSGFYFCYFAIVGTLVPYFSLYYLHLGFNAAQIGQLGGAVVLGRVIAPTCWGWIADHFGRRMPIVRWTLLLSTLSFLPFLLLQGFGALLAVMLVFGFFWSASLPLFEATTLNHLGERVGAYTHVRIWGSIGFIIAVTVLGSAIERWSVILAPVAVFALLAATWGLSLATPERGLVQASAMRQPFRAVLFRPEVLALFAVCFLLQLAYGPYYNFYSVFLERHGYSPSVIGRLWALGVLAEVAIFIVMQRLLRRYSLRSLMLASGLSAVIRWPMIAFGVNSLGVLAGAQLLHALTFGVQHAAAMQLIHRYFKGYHQGRGQALYSSLAYGLGGACGAVASGYAWELAGATWTFIAAAVCSALAVAIAWRWLESAPG